MSLVYDHKRDYDTALEYSKKALIIDEKVWGKEHPATLRHKKSQKNNKTHCFSKIKS